MSSIASPRTLIGSREDAIRAESRQFVRQDMPAIHAVLRWETLGAGRNQERAGYQVRLEACTTAGIATVPLTRDEIDRLDTGRIEIMINSGRQRVRQTHWTLGMDDGDPGVQGACRFHLAEDVGETTSEDTMDMSWAPLETEPVAEATAAARLGWTELGHGSVAGQPCLRWRRSVDGKGPVEDVCVWSGQAMGLFRQAAERGSLLDHVSGQLSHRHPAGSEAAAGPRLRDRGRVLQRRSGPLAR